MDFIQSKRRQRDKDGDWQRNDHGSVDHQQRHLGDVEIGRIPKGDELHQGPHDQRGDHFAILTELEELLQDDLPQWTQSAAYPSRRRRRRYVRLMTSVA